MWWQYLAVFDLLWDRLTVQDVGGFLSWLRTGDSPGVVSIQARPARFSESTIELRLRAVMSCYEFHCLNGVSLGAELTRLVQRRGGRYLPMLEHGRAGRDGNPYQEVIRYVRTHPQDCTIDELDQEVGRG